MAAGEQRWGEMEKKNKLIIQFVWIAETISFGRKNSCTASYKLWSRDQDGKRLSEMEVTLLSLTPLLKTEKETIKYSAAIRTNTFKQLVLTMYSGLIATRKHCWTAQSDCCWRVVFK